MSEFTLTAYCHQWCNITVAERNTDYDTSKQKMKTWRTHKICVLNSVSHNEGIKHEYTQIPRTPGYATVAQAVHCWPQTLWFNLRPRHVRFEVDKVEVGQILLQVLQLCH